jgi:hypothetical protein
LENIRAFFSANNSGAVPESLNWRYDVLIQKNIDFIRGRRILGHRKPQRAMDRRCVEGWCPACHWDRGAATSSLYAEQTLAHYGIPEGQYLFLRGEVFRGGS